MMDEQQRDGKGRRGKTVGEIFADLPTLPAGTRPPRVVSIATPDDVAIRFAETLAIGYKLAEPNAGDPPKL